MNFLLFDSFIPIKIFNFEGSSGLSLFSGSVSFRFFGGGRGGEPGDGGSAGVVNGCLGDGGSAAECSGAAPRDGGGGGERRSCCGDVGLDP